MSANVSSVFVVLVPLCMSSFRAPALAQAQVCFNDSIPLTPTNFINQSVTVSRFDPDLGILTAIEFTLAASAEGFCAVESIDGAPVTTFMTFEATLRLLRPDATILVVTAPTETFIDHLTMFDGIIDFRGTSGITHSGIVALASETETSAPPSADLTLFTGPPGNPGTIALEVEGLGTSWLTCGPGLIMQFFTSASADVTVCYHYELDCNDNDVPDTIDIANATSVDCNGNGVPDECEVDPGMRYCFGFGCPCGNDDASAGCANSSGVGVQLDGAGSASLAADDLLLIGSNLIPGQPALLFSAELALNGCAGVPFGDGLRCAGINARRLATALPDANGDALFGPGLLALESSPQAGDERRYQLWYRDPLGPCGSAFNLSNGFAVRFLP